MAKGDSGKRVNWFTSYKELEVQADAKRALEIDKATRRDAITVLVAIVFVVLAMVGCIALIVHDPTTSPEWQRENRKVLQQDAQKCQDLFAYWGEDLITEKQTKQLQECIKRWGEK